ncbi:MAG: hypothetical protein KDC54_23425, partial [Lewinella sp.]|nr:hypothetical protein [Lewinella sp.]
AEARHMLGGRGGRGEQDRKEQEVFHGSLISFTSLTGFIYLAEARRQASLTIKRRLRRIMI